MKNRTLAGLLMALALIASSPSSYAQNFKSLKEALKNQGYPVQYIPPRDNWLPGVVLNAKVDSGRLKVSETVCRSLFPPVDLEVSDVRLANYQAVKEKNFDVGLNLLKAILGGLLTGELGFDSESMKEIEITFSDETEYSLYGEDVYEINEAGEVVRRAIDPRCQARIKEYKDNGDLDKLYVITRVLSAKFLYDLAKSKKLEGQLDVGLKDILDTDVDASYKVTGRTTLVVEQPFNIAAAGVSKLENFIETGDISRRFDITLVPISVDVIEEQEDE
ncbi:MAG: hypothetical protein RIF37_15320 [Rhodospirillaceae bacterium]